jgi:hypothetical protein
VPNDWPRINAAAKRYGHLADAEGRKHGISGETLLRRIIKGESGGRKGAVSSAGARGWAPFMPATRASFKSKYGVDAYASPEQAVHAAALYMKTSGLAAYNPGMSSYSSYILGQRAPHDRPAGRLAGSGRRGRGGGRGGRRGTPGTPGRTVRGPSATSTTTTVTPAVDRSQERAALLSSFLGDKHSDIVQFALGMRDLKDSPEQRSSTSTETPGEKFRVPGSPGTPGTRGARGRRGAGGGRRGGLVHGHRLKIRGPVGSPGHISELFWQGRGGIDAKEGKVVPQGFVSGHTDHVHVATPTPAEIVRVGKMAQRMGLHVGEQPHFGPVHRVHVANSNHYANRAIDVSGDPAKMRQFAHTVARHYGLK